MKSISIWAAILLLLSTTAGLAQTIKNAKTEQVKIKGNCGMCKSTIENAGNVKKAAAVSWNADTEMAVITYDSTKTFRDEILKRIALAGYDNDAFLAPDDVYNNLPGCCQYNRNKAASKMKMEADHSMHHHGMAAAGPGSATEEDYSMRNHEANDMVSEPMQQAAVKAIYERYFDIKDALIKSDGKTAALKAKELTNSMAAVKMASLSATEHTAWMQLKDKLRSDADRISGTQDVARQRDDFARLSANMYKLMKAAKHDTPIYFQHCPMFAEGKGADWLSRDKTIRNPYYGSKMLTCGSTTETLN